MLQSGIALAPKILATKKSPTAKFCCYLSGKRAKNFRDETANALGVLGLIYSLSVSDLKYAYCQTKGLLPYILGIVVPTAYVKTDPVHDKKMQKQYPVLD